LIQINYRDSRPIYEQVMDGLRRLIISGALRPDDKLPSVREIARDLAINPNTIQRAYRELETDGYVYTLAGKGCFVSELPDENRKRKAQLFAELDRSLEELIFLGITKEEILQHFDDIDNQAKGGDDK